MATRTEVANRALLALGLDKLDGNIGTDTSYQADRARVLFDTTLLSVLEEFPWSFADTRVQLTQNATAPVSGWDHAYDLPTTPAVANIVAVRASQDDFDTSSPRPDKGNGDIAYELAEPLLLTDADEVWLRYTRVEEDTTNWSQLAAEAFAFKLASELAVFFTEAQSKRDAMIALFDKAIVKARSRNARNKAQKRPRAVGWLAARYSGC